MTTQADAVTEQSADPPPPADAGPRVTLHVLRVVAVLHSLAFLGQPVFAGRYLEGDIDALALHDANAFDHRMDSTAAQVHRGLAGFHLVTDDEEAALPLPRGDRDIPLMITDRAFDADGSFRYPTPDHALHTTGGVTDTYMEGVLGDVILVNGAPWPVLEVAAARYRLRLLNASNARRYQLRLAPARTPFIQIGSDGGLLDHPVEQTTILLAPGERADVVVDFAAFPPSTAVTMNNTLGAGSTAQVMLFRVTGRASDDSHIPAHLSHI
ncbi:hypothetical protein QOZ89_23885 [Pseudofrankia sp. BMG5.37]|nr:hypothetical protein [Pseudofrankia sp. BMG5.37]MDT3442613.1 hypothetical protein [Pseudofrankia sp. BMG5.37]